MSYQVGSTCYSSALVANQAVAASIAGTVGTVGGQSVVISVQAVSDSSITYGYTPLAGGATASTVVALLPMPCGLLDTADGLLLGWAVAAAWLATAAVLFLRKGVHE